MYLNAGLIDELRLQIAPIIVGNDVRLFDGVAGLDLEHPETRPTAYPTHVHYRVWSANDD